MKIIGENNLKQLLALLKFNFDNKVDKISGKSLSANDYTNEEKNKLSNIEERANCYQLPTATQSVLGGIKSGLDITIDNNGNVSVNDNSHKHTIDNIDGLESILDAKAPILCQTDNLTDGSVTRAKLANDALYSPMVILNADKKEYAISASDIGKTIYTHSGNGNNYVVTLDAIADANIPVGAEMAICRLFGDSLTVKMSGVVVCHSEMGHLKNGVDFAIPDNYSMIALKKILISDSVGYWLVTGNVEVVS